MLNGRFSSLRRALGICALFTSSLLWAQNADIEPKLKQAVSLDPTNFEANYELGEFYFHSGKLLEGIPYMEKAQSLRPADYVSGYDLALAYFDTHEYTKARHQLQTMLGRKDSAELHSLLADVDEAAGDYLVAAKEYQQAARMDPSEENIFNWGTELLAHRAWGAAVEVFNSGVALHDKSAKLNLGLGIALYWRGDYDRAIKALCLATDLNPSEAWPYVFLGKLSNVATINMEEVRKRFARFTQLQPNNAQAFYYYAMSLWNRIANSDANLPQVESLLKRAVLLDPSFADAHFQLGILYSDQSKYAEAINEFKRAIALQPNLTTAHYHLAQAYKRTGQKTDAGRELHLFEDLRQQDQVEVEKERNDIVQLIITMKEQSPSAPSR